jgi:hypothetical protein
MGTERKQSSISLEKYPMAEMDVIEEIIGKRTPDVKERIAIQLHSRLI